MEGVAGLCAGVHDKSMTEVPVNQSVLVAELAELLQQWGFTATQLEGVGQIAYRHDRYGRVILPQAKWFPVEGHLLLHAKYLLGLAGMSAEAFETWLTGPLKPLQRPLTRTEALLLREVRDHESRSLSDWIKREGVLADTEDESAGRMSEPMPYYFHSTDPKRVRAFDFLKKVGFLQVDEDWDDADYRHVVVTQAGRRHLQTMAATSPS